MMQAAGGLRARGHRVTAVTPPSAEIAEYGATLGIEMESGRFSGLFDLATVLRLRRIITQKKPDVLHVHKGLAHWLALVALIGNPLPALITNRGVSFPLTPFNRGKYRSSRTDRVITVCEAIKDVIRISGKVDPKKIEVVYAGTDMTRFDRNRVDPVRFRKREGIPADAFVILQSGTRDWKGWKQGVDAFEALRARVPDSRLMMVGNDGADREAAVRSYLLERDLSDVTHFLGYRSDIEEVIAASDVTVDASWDGTGITGTIRESMAIGTAVIATDCGGNRELIRDSSLGWLIEPQQHSQLVDALRQAAADPEKRMCIAREAARFVRPNFSIDRRIDRLESIYLSAAQARRAHQGVPSPGESAGFSG